jgi:hypothetical protein
MPKPAICPTCKKAMHVLVVSSEDTLFVCDGCGHTVRMLASKRAS